MQSDIIAPGTRGFIVSARKHGRLLASLLSDAWSNNAAREQRMKVGSPPLLRIDSGPRETASQGLRSSVPIQTH